MLVGFGLVLYLYKVIFSFFFLYKGDKFISLTTQKACNQQLTTINKNSRGLEVT